MQINKCDVQDMTYKMHEGDKARGLLSFFPVLLIYSLKSSTIAALFCMLYKLEYFMK